VIGWDELSVYPKIQGDNIERIEGKNSTPWSRVLEKPIFRHLSWS
jgi:hypothetical protein